MTQLCANREDLRVAVSDPEECHERATAVVLAAVASGLTASPEELSAKHKLNRGGGVSAAGEKVVSPEARGAVATPAIQKVRDYQLQVSLSFHFPHEARSEVPSDRSSLGFRGVVPEGNSKTNVSRRKWWCRLCALNSIAFQPVNSTLLGVPMRGKSTSWMFIGTIEPLSFMSR